MTEQLQLQLAPDHSKDPCPLYLDPDPPPALMRAWRKRYERRMTGYAVPLPERKPRR